MMYKVHRFKEKNHILQQTGALRQVYYTRGSPTIVSIIISAHIHVIYGIMNCFTTTSVSSTICKLIVVRGDYRINVYLFFRVIIA